MKPIHKFNNGRGAMICNNCSTIISIGKRTDVLYCGKCINELVDAICNSIEVKEFYNQMDKEVHSDRGNINK
jgi:hypothetical protein